MSAVTLLTAGRAAAAERDIQAAVESAGPRLITINVAAPSPGFDQAALARVEAIRGVTWVLGLGVARDVHPALAGLGTNVAGRELATPLPPEVSISAGRAPRPGEAIVSDSTQSRLRLLEPSGLVVSQEDRIPVVGRFSARAELSSLGRLVLFEPVDRQHASAALLYVLADQADDVASIVKEVQALSGIEDTDSVTVDTSPDLIELGHAVSGQIGTLGRQLAFSAILIGLLLIALTVTMSLLNRRRDFGRRRALGATRSALLALTLMESAIPIGAGAILGTIGGAVATAALTGEAPPAAFCVGALALVVVIGVIAAVPPTLTAAWRDPVRTLRVP
ncbi:ABC transporter permease [Galbitalea sp. SE-J8]|uniref:FtsX-like permease family protein n=1 Tax=Galbitalea sp. SE-J8 TaxID=3054952 RepID=UPI00259CE1E0|nr:FtsX-like permease family protein [Galbitalea sp. SE-J8]MDM4764108.1 ABC transporter permease [Galbitalea sp. SE-J8]